MYQTSLCLLSSKCGCQWSRRKSRKIIYVGDEVEKLLRLLNATVDHAFHLYEIEYAKQYDFSSEDIMLSKLRKIARIIDVLFLASDIYALDSHSSLSSSIVRVALLDRDDEFVLLRSAKELFVAEQEDDSTMNVAQFYRRGSGNGSLGSNNTFAIDERNNTLLELCEEKVQKLQNVKK